MMKIIFLDIDGVLNVISQGHDEFGGIFHAHFEANLNKIIKQTGAKIVITSTWRSAGLSEMQRMWKYRNLPGEVIDITLFGERQKRGYEIQSWLDNNHCDNYVILDDDTDMLESQAANFVRCSGNIDHPDCIDIGYGLTQKCAEAAIKILNGDK